MDGEEDSDQQDAENQAEDAAVPDLIGLTQGGKADAHEQDEDHESAKVETKMPPARSQSHWKGAEDESMDRSRSGLFNIDRL